MLCERCKMREANIRYTEVVNGVATEHNICSQCARELDLGQYSGLAGLIDGDYPIGRLISQLLGLQEDQSEGSDEDLQELPDLVCPTCHTSYADFVKNSQFGCPDCYHMFDLLISDKLKQMHGSDTHTGKHAVTEEKIPEESVFEKPLTTQERIDLLRSRIQEAVSEEDYESAARYRDEIRTLEASVSDEGGES